ncbi:MAG: hypothetical protein ACKO24_19575 [Leptolyngbyaceae cyanobacterium]
MVSSTGNVNNDGSHNNVLNLAVLPGITIAVYQRLLEQQVMPFLTHFQPDLLLVSAGYDATVVCHKELIGILIASTIRCPDPLKIVLRSLYLQCCLNWRRLVKCKQQDPSPSIRCMTFIAPRISHSVPSLPPKRWQSLVPAIALTL